MFDCILHFYFNNPSEPYVCHLHISFATWRICYCVTGGSVKTESSSHQSVLEIGCQYWLLGFYALAKCGLKTWASICAGSTTQQERRQSRSFSQLQVYHFYFFWEGGGEKKRRPAYVFRFLWRHVEV